MKSDEVALVGLNVKTVVQPMVGLSKISLNLGDNYHKATKKNRIAICHCSLYTMILFFPCLAGIAITWANYGYKSGTTDSSLYESKHCLAGGLGHLESSDS